MFDDMLDMPFPSITGQTETVREAMSKLDQPKPQLYFSKGMDYFKFNNLVEQEIVNFLDENDLDDDDDNRRSIISLLQNVGVEFDGCSGCGAMPMGTNCNNARCQDN